MGGGGGDGDGDGGDRGRGGGRDGGGMRELLGVGRVVQHLADGQDDGVAVDAVELEQLVGLAAAGGVGHRQALQAEVGLVDHRCSHGLAETPCKGRVHKGNTPVFVR